MTLRIIISNLKQNSDWIFFYFYKIDLIYDYYLDLIDKNKILIFEIIEMSVLDNNLLFAINMKMSQSDSEKLVDVCDSNIKDVSY